MKIVFNLSLILAVNSFSVLRLGVAEDYEIGKKRTSSNLQSDKTERGSEGNIFNLNSVPNSSAQDDLMEKEFTQQFSDKYAHPNIIRFLRKYAIFQLVHL